MVTMSPGAHQNAPMCKVAVLPIAHEAIIGLPEHCTGSEVLLHSSPRHVPAAVPVQQLARRHGARSRMAGARHRAGRVREGRGRNVADAGGKNKPSCSALGLGHAVVGRQPAALAAHRRGRLPRAGARAACHSAVHMLWLSDCVCAFCCLHIWLLIHFAVPAFISSPVCLQSPSVMHRQSLSAPLLCMMPCQ